MIEQVERKFELILGAITVSAKIDRIERNALTGAVRVIDYKTSDQGVSPLAAHVRNARKEETAPDWARVYGRRQGTCLDRPAAAALSGGVGRGNWAWLSAPAISISRRQSEKP